MSTIQATNFKHNASASNNIVLDSSGNAAFAGNVTVTGNMTSSGTVVPASSFLRNRIINGDMRIAQRGTGAVSAALQFPVDRFYTNHSFDGVVNAQQSAIAPPGFTNSIGFTVSTPDTSLGASQFFNFRQSIEGFNTADFGFGAAGAQTITLSFWVRSSVTGTYAISIENGAFNRVYPTSYNINAANTWEYKTIVISGDTTGTWRTDNGIGLSVLFNLAVGSSFQGTPNVWNASSIYAPSGTLANWVGTNGATFYVTGVQLEVGTVATPFERRQFGQELALCQRYFSKTFPTATAIQDKTGTNVGAIACPVPLSVTGFYGSLWQYPVTMRATPTLTYYAPQSSGTNNWVNGGNNTTSTPTAAALSSDRTYIFMANGNAFSLGGADVFYIHATANAEL